MPAERYYIESEIQPNLVVELKNSEFHHLVHVMRSKKGDEVELVNGKGSIGLAIINDLKKDKALLQIIKAEHHPSPPFRLILAQAFPKPHRLDLILEKGTELGVNEFWLFPGHHSAQKNWFPSNMDRAKSVTIAAMKQCGRLDLPQVCYLPELSMDKWKDLQSTTPFFGDLSTQACLFQSAWYKEASHKYPIVFAIGPEGGFSNEEEDILRNLGAIGVRLHENILRTETASIMAISLLSHWLLEKK